MSAGRWLRKKLSTDEISGILNDGELRFACHPSMKRRSGLVEQVSRKKSASIHILSFLHHNRRPASVKSTARLTAISTLVVTQK